MDVITQLNETEIGKIIVPSEFLLLPINPSEQTYSYRGLAPITGEEPIENRQCPKEHIQVWSN